MKAGNGTSFNLFLKPSTDASFKVAVWLDGPWDNEVWKGKKIAEITVPAGTAHEVTRYTVDVADAVDGLDKKHAIYLVAEGDAGAELCALQGVGFSKKGSELNYPAVPSVEIKVDGQSVELPTIPVRSTNENGYVGYDQYAVEYTLPADGTDVPKVEASSNDSRVKVEVTQPDARNGKAVVKFDYNGKVKTYTVVLK